MSSFRDVDDYLADAWAELHAANNALGYADASRGSDPARAGDRNAPLVRK
jgi:hypothetical protein